MKKTILKKFKRLLSLGLVLLLNTNAFAAVSSNDASAFVTKAEFDAVVDTFIEQMDKYEYNLISKIDGSIANYLANISTIVVSEKPLFYSNWDEISCINGVIDPTFSLPNVNIFLGGGVANYFSYSSYYKYYAQPMFIRFTYTGSTGVIRPLVTNAGTEASGGGNMYWGGVAEKYTEQYNLDSSIVSYQTADMAGVEVRKGTYQFSNGTRINIGNGYNSSFETSTSVINPTVYWLGGGSSSWQTVGFPTRSNYNRAAVTLGTNSSGKTTIYDHIIQYSGSSQWWVSNKDFTKTFMKHSSNSYKASSLLSSSSKSYSITTAGLTTEGNNRYRTSISAQFTTGNDDILPSIGMFSTAKSASSIYLTKDVITYEVNGSTKTLPTKTLQKGFPILYAEKDAVVTWSPYFTKGKTKSGSSWVDSTASYVALVLSVGEFSDKIVATNKIEAKSTSGASSYGGGVKCAINKNEVITFTMPQSGVVYAKWVPDVSNYDSTSWIQPLKLSECDSYLVEVDTLK